MIEIRLCNYNERDNLQEFINTEWKGNHVLVQSSDLLSWQHFNISTNQFNFVIGYDTTNKMIVGMLGFIPTSQYDYNLIKNADIWLAIWKVKNETKGLGLELLNFVINLYKPHSIGAIGINNAVKKLYRALQFKTGKLIHYYYLNPDLKDFRIAQISKINKEPFLENSNYTIRMVDDFSVLDAINHRQCPLKSNEYLRNRYLNHPIYKYEFYGIFLKDRIECILITRKILINNSACIRIIDIYGNLSNIDTIESELARLLVTEGCEYIDCLNFGIPSEVFLKLGFRSLVDDNIIIPNYFEPFEQENIVIEFAYICDSSPYVIFKGDSDQDRPNQILNE